MKKIVILSNIIAISLSLYGDTNDDIYYAMKDGERIYKETCISCHGADGKSNTAMKLVVKPRDLTKTILDKNQIFKVIKNGSKANGSKADIMPAFKYVYNDEELENISLYITNKFAKNQSTLKEELLKQSKNRKDISLKRGKKIYKRNCSLCHGKKGDGDSPFVKESKDQSKLIYPYDLTKIPLDENQIFLYSKYGGNFWGTYKDDMPSWKKKYDDYTLKSVAYYITHYLQNGKK